MHMAAGRGRTPRTDTRTRTDGDATEHAVSIMTALAPLTADELLQFKNDGYILRRSALSRTLLAKAQDVWWGSLEHPNAPPRLRRDDQSTWRGELPGKDVGDPKMSWGNLGWRCRLVGDHPALLDLLPRAAFDLAEQLAGTCMTP